MYFWCICDVLTMYCVVGIWVHEQEGNTSQYICQYITIHCRIHHNTSKIHPNTSVMYWDVHLWCIGMLIHPKNIWYIQNTSQYIPIHRVHPPRFANGRLCIRVSRLSFGPNMLLCIVSVRVVCLWGGKYGALPLFRGVVGQNAGVSTTRDCQSI